MTKVKSFRELMAWLKGASEAQAKARLNTELKNRAPRVAVLRSCYEVFSKLRRRRERAEISEVIGKPLYPKK